MTMDPTLQHKHPQQNILNAQPSQQRILDNTTMMSGWMSLANNGHLCAWNIIKCI